MHVLRKRDSISLLATAVAAGLAGSSSSALAQTFNPTSGTNAWDISTNWTPNTVPNAVGATVTFPFATGTRSVPFSTAGGNYTVGVVNFPSPDATTTSFATTIGATDEANGTVTFDNGGSGAQINISATANTLSNYIGFRAPVVLNDTLIANVDPRTGGNQIALNFLGGSQSITGTGGITKNGLGVMSFADTWTFGGVTDPRFGTSQKTFTGPLTVNAGRVRMQPAIANAGGLVGTSAVNVNASGPIHTIGFGALNIPEGGQIQFDTSGAADTGKFNNFGPNNGTTTVITLNGGGMNDTLFNSGLIGAIRVETGRQTTVNNPIVLASDTIVAEAASGSNFTSQLTFAGNISGPGMLVNNDHNGGFSGTLVLSGNNSYTGGNMINDGTTTVTTATGLGSTTGPLIVNNENTVSAGRPVVVNLYTGGATTVGSLSGQTAVPSGGTNTTTINNPVGLTVTQTADKSFDGTISGAGSFTKAGAAKLTLTGVNNHTGGTNVTAGTLVAGHSAAFANGALDVADGATAQVQPGLANAVVVTTLNTHSTGQMDVTNGSMVIRGSTAAAVTAQIVSGFNGGAWNGPGINSSTAAADANGLTAIGYASNADYGASDFKGVSGLTPADVLVRYTYYGDADLSGDVTLDDFSQFLNGYQTQSAATNNWLNGDFDYDGAVTLDDFSQFLFGYQHQGAPLGALESMIESSSLSSADKTLMLAAVEAVPEPTSLALLGLAGAGLLARRRRRGSVPA